MKKRVFAASLVAILFCSCLSQHKNYFVKEVAFQDDITVEERLKLAARLVPTDQQYAWQQLELTAFIHFGMNTFTDREWGDGQEDPALFNPTEFDAEQWVVSLQEAGFKMIILTAKHHDGFCLWPTSTTTHSIRSSGWKGGNGDIVGEVKDACDKHGMKFGVYLSPWDRNAESYGDSPRYNAFFVEQLKELLTNYGEIHEVWFDGANGEGPNGKRQIYDWARFYHVIDSLQPKAVKAIMGNDIRWVGNESGLGRETEWSVTPLNPDINEAITEENKRLEINPMSSDLGSRDLIAKARKLYWYPSEVDVSIRPGWFYHQEQDHQVKTLQQLVDIYYQSVGMNSVLLLNVPPDKRGLLHEADVARLKEFGKYIRNTFEKNRIKEGDLVWTAKNGEQREFASTGDTINTVMLQEEIRKGQRVERFKVEGLIGNEWRTLAEGTTIGYKRLVKFDDCAPSRLRITIADTRDKAHILAVGAYLAPQIREQSDDLKLSDPSKEKWSIKEQHPLVVDMGDNHSINGFTYNPYEEEEAVFNYIFSVSGDGKSWTELKRGEFGNIKNNPVPQFVRFDKNVSARLFRFEAIIGTEGGKPNTSIDQVGILIP
ncbi:alpha-L-fucosidase [Petrimonas mucosa]|uniref:alpha-L-fucosidase n=1 Tax=Petrimonas mucosa TaxID=1642646 RepID=UPI003C751279